MSASFPYDSYFLKAVGFVSSIQLQPNVFCVGGMCNICTILVLKKFQSSGGHLPPLPPPLGTMLNSLNSRVWFMTLYKQVGQFQTMWYSHETVVLQL